MNEEYFAYVILGTGVLALVVLLIGALIPTRPRRGFSDWVMIGGMLLSFAAIVTLLLLIFGMQPYSYPRGNYELWQNIMMGLAFAIPGGVLIFGGGFLLARMEARREAAQLQFYAQGFAPTHVAPPPPQQFGQPPGGV